MADVNGWEKVPLCISGRLFNKQNFPDGDKSPTSTRHKYLRCRHISKVT